MEVTVYGANETVAREFKDISYVRILQANESGTLCWTKPEVKANLLLINPQYAAAVEVRQGE